MIIRDLNIRVIHAATGGLLRELTLNLNIYDQPALCVRCWRVRCGRA
jgi:hypothetical protein